jgi:hypothetical protein
MSELTDKLDEKSKKALAPDRAEWAKDLFLAFECRGDFFNAELLKLIHKADPGHRLLLARGFPIAVDIHDEWCNTPVQKDFFRFYGVGELLCANSDEKKLFDRMYGPDAPVPKL